MKVDSKIDIVVSRKRGRISILSELSQDFLKGWFCFFLLARSIIRPVVITGSELVKRLGTWAENLPKILIFPPVSKGSFVFCTFENYRLENNILAEDKRKSPARLINYKSISFNQYSVPVLINNHRRSAVCQRRSACSCASS